MRTHRNERQNSGEKNPRRHETAVKLGT